jgi:hypothetical protein
VSDGGNVIRICWPTDEAHTLITDCDREVFGVTGFRKGIDSSPGRAPLLIVSSKDPLLTGIDSSELPITVQGAAVQLSSHAKVIASAQFRNGKAPVVWSNVFGKGETISISSAVILQRPTSDQFISNCISVLAGKKPTVSPLSCPTVPGRSLSAR